MRFLNSLRRSVLSLLGRRRHRRSTAIMSADWHVFGSHLHYRSVTEDISSLGARLISTGEVAVGSPLVVRLETERGTHDIHARVAWSKPPSLGIRFTREAHAITG